MAETMFVRMHEINEWEGEAWDWWLQLDGNETALGHLADALGEAFADDDEPAFTLHLDQAEPESIVDKLVEYGAEGYYAAHNKVPGTLTVPGDLSEDPDLLYKGGIRGLFTTGG